MTGHIAVVTGGTRGIGAAISLALSASGARVAAIYRNDDTAASVFSRASGIRPYQLDVTDYDACLRVIDRIQKDLGPIDILVNNAGITRDGMFHKSTPQDWTAVLNTNLSSCFHMCHGVIGGMRDRQFGRIINISSINGQKGQLGQVNYAAAKAGIFGFTKALALENAPKNITVNAIAPGYIETDMTHILPDAVLKSITSNIPVGHLGTPHDIARGVVFLASKDASFITGATLTINGGQYMI